MRLPTLELSRGQALAIGSGSLVATVGLVWLVLTIGGNGGPVTSTTATSLPPPTNTFTTTTATTSTTTTLPDTTTTSTPETTTTADGQPTTTSTGVFDEVGAVEAFITEFAEAIASGDSEFLFDRLHPAVKATYDEAECLEHIDDEILLLESYRSIGPIVGPLDSEFGEFPITSYEVPVAFDFEDEEFESNAVFSLTEGTVRWFTECS
ncbi:MAG: hypothetical protein WDZ96_01450 [Acidimicrobiia bacterium]